MTEKTRYHTGNIFYKHRAVNGEKGNKLLKIDVYFFKKIIDRIGYGKSPSGGQIWRQRVLLYVLLYVLM